MQMQGQTGCVCVCASVNRASASVVHCGLLHWAANIHGAKDACLCVCTLSGTAASQREAVVAVGAVAAVVVIVVVVVVVVVVARAMAVAVAALHAAERDCERDCWPTPDSRYS